MAREAWLSDAATVAGALDADLERGLSGAEAARRLATDGPNEISSAPPLSTWRRLVRQFRDPLVYLLLVAVAISVVVWAIGHEASLPYDALVILVIVVLNAIIGLTQEQKADQAVAALRQMTEAKASVVRDGTIGTVAAHDLVRGDLLHLAEGDAVPADARLISSSGLVVSEASLTGESLPVRKDPATLGEPVGIGDRLNMVHSGTAVTQGSATAVVTATGMDSEMGRIATMLESIEDVPTPLQREMSRVGKMLGLAVLVIAVVVMVTIALTSGVHDLSDAETILLLGVSLAVAAVPEGLPAILSVVLALGVQRMAKRHAIVKELSSVETLGSATVVCSDKTGTLTRNEMTITHVVTSSGESTLTGSGYDPDGVVVHNGEPLGEGPVLGEVVLLLGGGRMASQASLGEEEGRWIVHGDPTDGAFVVAERKLAGPGLDESRFSEVAQIPFTSDRKLMTSANADAHRDGAVTIVTKGAPDVLLDRCSWVQRGEEALPLDEESRGDVIAAIDRLSAQALRTLGVAYRRLDVNTVSPEDDWVEHDLVYAGTVGMIDPPRLEATEAIRDAHRAGVRVLMITGDHPLTAARIAEDLGIAEEGASVLTGVEIEELDDEALAEAVRWTDVYARVSPRHKLRIVDALQSHGEIVAMTGDGVNDAPALKSADIGVAMGISGTEVAKEAATMILADDNFATIIQAVRQGRAIFDNVKKFLRYLLSSNLGEVLTVFFGVVFAGVIGLKAGDAAPAVPLLATQILWINLLTDAGPALAMGVDPEIDDVMVRPPRQIHERVIDRRMWGGVILVGLVMAAVTLMALDLYLPGGLFEGHHSVTNARTAAFTVLVLAQLFNAFNARSEKTTALRRLWDNHWLWVAVAISFLLQLAAVYVPFLNTALKTAPLSLDQWLVCTALASAVLWVVELKKLLVRLLTRRDRPVPAG
jgi:magnesium-transporting ATPase (P-type)